MNVLLIGGGGREHAIAWKLKQSPRLTALFIAPGNPGMATLGQLVQLNVLDIAAVVAFAQAQAIALVVVGPEEPLVAGLADACRAAGIAVVGPSQAAARLEASKHFAKDFMHRHSIPTASYASFTAQQWDAALRHLRREQYPLVVKADGLAGGKGVYICTEYKEAETALKGLLQDSRLGVAGQTVVIEQFLDGIEVSFFALCDGQHYVLLPEAKDYKRLLAGDKGPNTGGMGSVSPVYFSDDAFKQRVEELVIRPTLRGMAKEGAPFQGFLFAGLMNVHGVPYVLEYNVRLGDPETQSILPRLQSDLLELLWAAANGQLARQVLQVSTDFAVTTVCVSQGYPQQVEKGFPIQLGPAGPALTFHAGTAMAGHQLVTAGGRVLALTALAPTLNQAVQASQAAAAAVHYQGKAYRKDIGEDLALDDLF